MLQVMMQKRSRNSTLCRVHPLRANLVQLDCLASRSADHAICLFSTLGMIQGKANRRRVLQHVARIIRPGGSFLIHVHNRWAALVEPGGMRRLTTSWFRSLRDPQHDFGDFTYAYRGLNHMFMHRFSRRELVRDLCDCGWRIETVSPISIDAAQVDVRTRIPGGFIVTAHVQRTASPA
jgi:SAM-dependent methyltransferase